ncbi:hypothetical protein O6H91_20G060000 [Diphasiastrum complanatum]|uniref:Uncharacterized protein n=1 Tax=Diphasiastrum complanatum TaxID=34168 RepID=A0ACC2AQU3_DIPCM|nr:hypothetical protein O6H91_20G060000 [Diphasiastrum complanatum]
MSPSVVMDKMQKKALFLLTILCLYNLVDNALAQKPEPRKDHRIARVRVINNSKMNIQADSIKVGHKYSDVYKNFLEFNKALAPGETDNGNGNMRVSYETGFWAIGSDWWQITWVFSDAKAIYQTNPKNGQCILNILEKAALPALSAAAAAIAGVAACGFPPIAGCAASPLAAAGAAVAAGVIAKAFFNDESTCGFKMFMLRSEDEMSNGAWVTITIGEGGKLSFSAPSGSATTVYEQIALLPDGTTRVGIPELMASTDTELMAATDTDTYHAHGVGPIGNNVM